MLGVINAHLGAAGEGDLESCHGLAWAHAQDMTQYHADHAAVADQ